MSLITEGLETAKFRSFFANWPQKVEPKLYEEGREKVAGIIFASYVKFREKMVYISASITLA